MKRREKSFASGSVFCSSFSADLLSPWWWLLGMVLSYWSFVVCVWLNKYTHSTNINEDSNNDSLSVSHCPTRFSLSLSRLLTTIFPIASSFFSLVAIFCVCAFVRFEPRPFLCVAIWSDDHGLWSHQVSQSCTTVHRHHMLCIVCYWNNFCSLSFYDDNDDDRTSESKTCARFYALCMQTKFQCWNCAAEVVNAVGEFERRRWWNSHSISFSLHISFHSLKFKNFALKLNEFLNGSWRRLVARLTNARNSIQVFLKTWYTCYAMQQKLLWSFISGPKSEKKNISIAGKRIAVPNQNLFSLFILERFVILPGVECFVILKLLSNLWLNQSTADGNQQQKVEFTLGNASKEESTAKQSIQIAFFGPSVFPQGMEQAKALQCGLNFSIHELFACKLHLFISVQ